MQFIMLVQYSFFFSFFFPPLSIAWIMFFEDYIINKPLWWGLEGLE